jgi:hypothetical protein
MHSLVPETETSLMARRINRREMLAASAASLSYLHLAPAFSAARIQGANFRVNFACIGVGGKGSSDADNVADCGKNYGGAIIAICDVDERHLNAKANQDGLHVRKGPSSSIRPRSSATSAGSLTIARCSRTSTPSSSRRPTTPTLCPASSPCAPASTSIARSR